MTIKEKTEALGTYFVFFAREDYTDLSSYAQDVRNEFELSNETEVRERTLAVLSDVMLRGLIRPGSLRKGIGFIPWKLDADASTRLIEHIWRDFKGDLHLGDVAWFEATKLGEEHVLDYSPAESGLRLEQTI